MWEEKAEKNIYITERLRNCDSIKCSKFHLSLDEIDRSGRGRHEEDAGENDSARSAPHCLAPGSAALAQMTFS